MDASVPDLIRLIVVPAFAWAAYRDVRTRRLPNRLWPPLVAVGIVALAWETVTRLPLAGPPDSLFALRVAVSLLVVAPLGYVFWRVGGFGGADAKALATLAVVYPTTPAYVLPFVDLSLPVARSEAGVFSLTILTNAVLVALAYPLALGFRNAAAGRLSPAMFLARRVPVPAVEREHGRLFETASGFTARGLDLDALRMYLRWRGCTLADLRRDPDAARDPSGVGRTFEPTDGAVAPGDGSDRTGPGAGPGSGAPSRPPGHDPDNGRDDGPGGTAASTGAGEGGSVGGEPAAGAGPRPDPWAADRFSREVGTPYGATPDRLREGLEVLTAREAVWVSPGLPFVVPTFVGLLIAVTYGDLLFGVLRLVGLA